MHWVTLIRHFTSLVSGTESRFWLVDGVQHDEGWVTLEELFEQAGSRSHGEHLRHIRFAAALLEDMGFLKRRDMEDRAEYRATFKAYVTFLGWPEIGPENPPGIEGG